jgi:cysteine desulfurase / selenocysteine lyase
LHRFPLLPLPRWRSSLFVSSAPLRLGDFEMLMTAVVPLHEIRAEFAELDDPADRLAYLVEIGKTLPPVPEEARTEENRVLGCQSMVWLVAQTRASSARGGETPTLTFIADSDAPMVRGLIAVLLAAYSGRTPQEIVSFPIEELFGELKLKSFITPMRSNGLYSMVRRIQSLAEIARHNESAGAANVLPVMPLAPRPRDAADTGDNGPPRRAKSPSLPATIVTGQPLAASPLDVEAIRGDFPILTTTLDDGWPLVYLDNAASTQRPRQVIDAMVEAYEHYYSNVHRGGHHLAAESTVRYEAARESIRALVNARSTTEIIFTSGTTAAINLVARSWGDANVRAGDEIVLTEMEHHSNIVPWQQLAERTGCTIRWVGVTDDFQLDMEAFERLLTPRTKLVAVTAVSNVLGTINPIDRIIEQAHSAGAIVLVDAAQGVPHEPIDVRGWDADFLAFSGHKMLGPSGVGVLYGREDLLEAMPPFLGGGSMIKQVTTDGFTPADLPYRFEAGTPMIVPAIGLGKAVQYLQKLGLESIRKHELALTRLAHEQLAEIPGIRFLGPAPENKGGMVTFALEGVHPDEVSKALDVQGIAVRAGHHCAMPLHARFGLPASTRASFYLYNTADEVTRLAAGLREARRIFVR